MENTFTIYKLKENFNIKLLDNGIWDCEAFTGNLNEILKELENNEGYNIRIDPKKPSIVYIDFDKCEDGTIIENFFKLLVDEFDIELNDIKYTLSKKSNKSLSYHITVPSMETTPEKLKKIFSLKRFDGFKKYLDLSVYSSHWFRLPMQTNKLKPKKHKIINGSMCDFIIENLDNVGFELPDFDDDIIKPIINELKPKINNYQYNEGKTHAEYIEAIIDGLFDSRADDKDDWFRVITAINNEIDDENEAYNIFKNFSKRSNKYNSKVDDKNFRSLIKMDCGDGNGIGSLIKMLKEDNPEKYIELKKEFIKPSIKYIINKYFKGCDNLNSTDIANHFKSLYSNKFIYQNQRLYYFNGVYWKVEDKKNLITLNNFIADVYYIDILKLTQKYILEIAEDKTIEKDVAQSKLQKINKFQGLLNDLLNYDKRQKYMSDILCKLNNDDVKFDEEPYLYAFNNKIYDLKQSKFIEPKPEQYISLTTGYNFIEQDETKNIKIIDDLINSIFRQPELKTLYLTILSTGLDGIPLEKFVIANGGGGNGKSLLNELVEYMMGNYCYILPSQILTGPLKTGSNPELANMNNKRLIYFREPDKDQKFNMSTVKDITGGSKINARVNYSNDTTTNLKLTFIGECNDKPKTNEINDAVMRRIIDIPFKSKFIDKFEYDELSDEDKKTIGIKNDFYKTTEFKDKYKQALFLILVKYHKEFLNNNRVLPITEEIMKRNRAYLADSDEFLSWFEDSYEKTENKKDIIKLKLVYNKFKTSDYFNNLNKLQKRQNNYKHFIEKIKSNMFLKKYVDEDCHGTAIIKNYIIKVENDNEDEDEDN